LAYVNEIPCGGVFHDEPAMLIAGAADAWRFMVILSAFIGFCRFFFLPECLPGPRHDDGMKLV
jgi:hypothetical protein